MDKAQIDLEEALEFAIGLAKRAGQIARQHYSPNLVFKPKDDNSPITKADVQINRTVIEACTKQYPGIGILGEEESSGSASEWLWVCDPIDGTIPYMLGAQISTFCLALVHDGQPVIGVVYDFLNDRLYSALKGSGAKLSGEPITPSVVAPLKAINLEMWAGSQPVGDLRDRLFGAGFIVTNFTSNAFMSMATTTGRFAGTIYTGPYAWDVAAAKVIVEELGCRVTDLDGQEQRYDGEVNGGVVLHPAYADEVQSLLAQARHDHENYRH